MQHNRLILCFVKMYMLLPFVRGFMGLLMAAGTLISGLKAQEAVQLTSFSFEQLTGGVVIVKASLDGRNDSLNFILDTGSGGISLDSTTAERLQVSFEQSDRTIKGIAGSRTVSFARGHSLHFPGLRIDNLDFHINDYELLTGVYGLKIDGIIGYTFLRRYIVKIDYEKQVIRVLTPGTLKYPPGGRLLKPAIVGLPMITARVEEERSILARYYMDTGAGLCMLFNESFINDSSVFKLSKRSYRTVAEGLGGKAEMEMKVLKRVRIAGYRFKKIPVFVFADPYNVTSYPQLGGLIGNDLLRRFNVVLNYPKSEIHLVPNNRFRDPFDYSYTGLGLYSESGSIYITDVIAGSPAEKAGLQVGDRVLAVDNNLSSSMQTYRNILQESGRRVKFLIERNKELIQTFLVVDRIKP